MTKSKDRVSDLVNGHASCYCRNSLTHSSVALVKQSTNNIIRHNIFSQEVFLPLIDRLLLNINVLRALEFPSRMAINQRPTSPHSRSPTILAQRTSQTTKNRSHRNVHP